MYGNPAYVAHSLQATSFPSFSFDALCKSGNIIKEKKTFYREDTAFQLDRNEMFTGCRAANYSEKLSKMLTCKMLRCWCFGDAVTVMLLRCWCYGADVTGLMLWWCCYGADVMVMLLRWCCCGADATGILLRWCCFGADVTVLILRWCCYGADVTVMAFKPARWSLWTSNRLDVISRTWALL